MRPAHTRGVEPATTAAFKDGLAAIHSALDVPALAGAAADLLELVAGCRSFSVLICNPEAGGFDIVWPEPLPDAPASLPIDTHILHMVFESGQSFAVPSRKFPKVPWGAGEMPVAACEPLRWHGVPFGLLVMHESGAGFQPANGMNQQPGKAAPQIPEPGLLAFVAEQIGLSLARTMIYQDACREAIDSAAMLHAVESLGDALSEIRLDSVLARILDLSLQIVSAEVGAILLREDGELSAPVQLGLEMRDVRGILAPDGAMLVEEVIETGRPVLIPDTATAEGLDLGAAGERVRSLVCVPLHTKERKLGALIVVNSSPDAGLNEGDVNLLTGISGLAATMIENAILHVDALERERLAIQMSIAADIQQSLLPDTPPRFDGIELAGWSKPCDETGGDYFDYLPIEGPRVVVVVGDVSNHGIGAALLMTTARAFLRSMLKPGCELPDVLARTNALLLADMQADRFMTLIAVEIDLDSRVLTYSSAGHEPPLLYHVSSDSFDELHSTGLPLGVFDSGEFPCAEPIELHPGDVVILTTDGIWEAHNAAGERFGRDRLREIIRHSSHASAEQISAAIREAFDAFRGRAQQEDDATIVVIKATATPD